MPRPFQLPLPIPPVKQPLRSGPDGDFYEITQRERLVEILPGLRTPIFGYDGIFPGPTIVSRRDRRTVVRHRNRLTVPTAVHLHGGHTPPEHDGYPVDLVFPPGADQKAWQPSGHHGHVVGQVSWTLGDVSSDFRDYEYPMRQRAASLWYHDHRMDFTGPQVHRGLAGFHIVHDDEEEALPLPRGDRDIPLMIVDRSFAADGSFAYPALDPSLRSQPGVQEDFAEGVLGDVILVNGAPWPVLEVDAVRYRLRILNGSNARRYRLALEPGPSAGTSFTQIGSDGGLLAGPVQHHEIVIAPAERFDVVVDFSKYAVGTEVTMVNRFGEDGTANVMRFKVVRAAADDTLIPLKLSEIPVLDPVKAVRRREWRFERSSETKNGVHGWTINGQAFDPGRVDAEARLGDVEVWRFSSDLHHPVHVHLDPFQVISRQGKAPGPYDAGWKDTVDVVPAEYVDVVIKFGEYAGKYLIHCHNLEHEDMMMMAAFRTVR